MASVSDGCPGAISPGAAPSRGSPRPHPSGPVHTWEEPPGGGPPVGWQGCGRGPLARHLRRRAAAKFAPPPALPARGQVHGSVDALASSRGIGSEPSSCSPQASSPPFRSATKFPAVALADRDRDPAQAVALAVPCQPVTLADLLEE